MANPNDNPPSIGKGGIRFYDNYTPALEAGDYIINISQRFNPKDSGIDESFQATQAFSVQGPRYTLLTGDIFSVFPAPNAQGVFDQSLPHVVFTGPELPWERNVFGESDPEQQTPWLALLLMVEGSSLKEKMFCCRL